MLWVAEGVVRQKGSDEELAEHMAERFISELLGRGIVQVTVKKLTGKVKTCRLPDAFRKSWFAKANDTKPTWLSNHLNDKEHVPSFHIHGDYTKSSILQYHYTKCGVYYVI